MKQCMGFLLSVLFVALQSTGSSLGYGKSPVNVVLRDKQILLGDTVRISQANGMVSFVAAAQAAMPAVVHIKVRFNSSGDYGASGSGVIVSTDGYIATNNHVVENASQIDITLPDKRTYKAKLIGRDPNTDLALIKVDADNLPVIKFGNSDALQVGEWVLAVGFPLSLNTTVTAGIVSAKARSIGIINRQGQSDHFNTGQPAGNTAVESFIQTDAAINPGNSGGALVNTDGELIGINSAIASQTGSYAGYAFAIPVNLAKKILDDLKIYGKVKRGVLGVSFPSPSAEDQYMIQHGLNPANIKGVYITGVQPGSAAAVGGLLEGDIIQSIDGITVNSSTEFSERIARRKPGDALQLTYLRNGATGRLSVTLNGEGEATVPKNKQPLPEIYSKLGATFAPLTNELKQRFGIKAGVEVTNVRRGGFFDQIGIPQGTVIAFINGQSINNPKDIDAALLSAQSGMIRIFAIAPDGSKVVFDFSLGT
jgi:serine protease Do